MWYSVNTGIRPRGLLPGGQPTTFALIVNSFRGIKCCLVVLGCFVSILFFKFVRRSVTAVTMDPLRVVKCVYVLENQLSCMVIIPDHKTVKPLPFDERMKALYAGIVPWKCFFGVAFFDPLYRL